MSVPPEISKEIRKYLGSEEEGWGRLKAKAQIRDTEWQTAIWFDTKRNTYLLPLKSEIRKKEEIQTGTAVRITITI